MVKKISLFQNSLDPGNPQNVVNLRYVHCVNHVSYSNPRIRACRIVDLNFNLSPCRKLATFSALSSSGHRIQLECQLIYSFNRLPKLGKLRPVFAGNVTNYISG